MSAADRLAQMPDPNRKRINIKVTPKHGNIFVDSEPMEVDWQRGEHIEWDFGGKPFKITFKDGISPFTESEFDHTRPYSGQVVVKKEGVYKYTVEANGKILDPTVIVEP
jgi:plastocyanin